MVCRDVYHPIGDVDRISISHHRGLLRRHQIIRAVRISHLSYDVTRRWQ